MTPTILLSTPDLLVINKPSGLMVHADGRSTEPTLADWLVKTYPKMAMVGDAHILPNGEEVLRPGIVHRLDRETSGVMVIAKNRKAFDFLKDQFEGREVEKVYHAFVYGRMDEEDGTIDRPIARNNKDFRLWSAQRGARGEAREAITEYKVLDRTAKLSFLQAVPRTGRTHQIRVHLKAINHPVVADKLYAPKMAPELGFKRLALHAKSLSFKDLKGKSVVVEAPYPEDFEKALVQFNHIAKE
jgi:23S rRNA pseudouridine1911/1915/1917 synthase